MSSWPATRRRPPGRHTSLIGAARDELDPMDPVEPVDRVFGSWPPPRGGDLNGGGPRVYIRGEEPGGGVRAWPDAGSDTIVLAGLGLFRDWPPAPGIAGPGTGPNRPVPRPWHRRRWRLGLISAGLAVLAVAGFLGVPPLLSALGLGSQATCPLCQFPIPSSAPIGAGTGPSPASSAPAPRPSAPSRAASAPATAPPVRVVATPPPASTPPPTLGVSYTAIPTGDGFTGQVTVVNRGSSAVSGWQLVVALPGDTVSAVQNAEFSEDADVLFMRPAPDDLSITPGGSVTVSIYASGPDPTPAECSFNDVACQ